MCTKVLCKSRYLTFTLILSLILLLSEELECLKSVSQREHFTCSCHLLSHEENTETGKMLNITHPMVH